LNPNPEVERSSFVLVVVVVSRIWGSRVAELTAPTNRAKVCLLLGAKARVEDDHEDEDENDSET
jgi:hypothetical protein